MPRTNFEELLDSGVHFGHLKRKWNPSMGIQGTSDFLALARMRTQPRILIEVIDRNFLLTHHISPLTNLMAISRHSDSKRS